MRCRLLGQLSSHRRKFPRKVLLAALRDTQRLPAVTVGAETACSEGLHFAGSALAARCGPAGLRPAIEFWSELYLLVMLLFDGILVTSSGNARFPLDAPTVTKILWGGCCSSAAAAEESRKCAHVTMSHVNMRVRRSKSSFQLLALFPYGIFVTSATTALFSSCWPFFHTVFL